MFFNYFSNRQSDNLKKRGCVKAETTLSAVELSGHVIKRGYLLKQVNPRKKKKMLPFLARFRSVLSERVPRAGPPAEKLEDSAVCATLRTFVPPLLRPHQGAIATVLCYLLPSNAHKHPHTESVCEPFPVWFQDDISPVGGFPLRGSLVSSLDDNGVPSGKSHWMSQLFLVCKKKCNDPILFVQSNLNSKWRPTGRCLEFTVFLYGLNHPLQKLLYMQRDRRFQFLTDRAVQYIHCTFK